MLRPVYQVAVQVCRSEFLKNNKNRVVLMNTHPLNQLSSNMVMIKSVSHVEGCFHVCADTRFGLAFWDWLFCTTLMSTLVSLHIDGQDLPYKWKTTEKMTGNANHRNLTSTEPAESHGHTFNHDTTRAQYDHPSHTMRLNRRSKRI